MPMLVYWMFVAFLVVVFCGAFIIIERVCKTLEAALQVVAYYTLRMRYMNSRNPTKFRRFNYLQARSIRPVRVKYGFFGWLGKNFMAAYFGTLLNKCFDALILF